MPPDVKRIYCSHAQLDYIAMTLQKVFFFPIIFPYYYHWNKLAVNLSPLWLCDCVSDGSAIFKGCFRRPDNVTLALPAGAVIQNMSVEKCVDMCTEKVCVQYVWEWGRSFTYLLVIFPVITYLSPPNLVGNMSNKNHMCFRGTATVTVWCMSIWLYRFRSFHW